MAAPWDGQFRRDDGELPQISHVRCRQKLPLVGPSLRAAGRSYAEKCPAFLENLETRTVLDVSHGSGLHGKVAADFENGGSHIRLADRRMLTLEPPRSQAAASNTSAAAAVTLVMEPNRTLEYQFSSRMELARLPELIQHGEPNAWIYQRLPPQIDYAHGLGGR